MKRIPDPAIVLTGISKKYEIHHDKPTLVEQFVKGKNETYWALNNISLTIQRGERVGIIGENGSGKTTLLKIIAGITTPTTGSIRRNGKIVSLIDLEAGFHPDLTGYQNVFLNGMIIGLSKGEIETKLQQIIDFADLKQFIDAPLFTYSSGMSLRLGFSIAIHAQPDILLLDEGLAVGDAYFQKKAQNRLNDLFRHGKTVIVVSHILNVIERTCDRIILLNRGTVMDDGGKPVIRRYLRRQHARR